MTPSSSWVSVLEVRCCFCDTRQGFKDGKGQSGITSTVCEYCRDWFMGEMAKYRRDDARAA